MTNWYTIASRAAGASAEVLIYSEIGGPDGITAKQFAKDLQAHSKAKTLTIRINSPGGDCFTATAIFNSLARHRARKTVHIDGIAASAASVIAMAGDEVIMPDNALLMIHRPYGAVVGNASDMQAMIEALDRVEASMVMAYGRSRQPTARIKALLAAETWMSAREAVDLGFADRVVDPVKIAACADFRSFPYKHAPQPSAGAAWDKVITNKFTKAAG